MRNKRWFTILAIAGTIFAVLFIIGAIFIFKDLPSPNSLEENETIPYSTHLYDRNGKMLYEIFHEENRTPVKLSSLPLYVRQATIAIEDKDFYRHQGISVVGGMLRALRQNLLNSGSLQGGSTITQQLVKSALLSPERTVTRKAKEIILALMVERKYSKDQILEMYLNQVPYGGTAWGIEEASQLYFGKHASKLTLPQAALLAGLPQAPSLYSPYVNPQGAYSRQHEVLKRMLDDHYITPEQYQKAKNTKLTFNSPGNTILAPHFVFYVKSLLEKEYGERRVQEGGLRVYTTLDFSLQASAQKILSEELESLKGYDVGNGAVLVTRPSTGEILAMVGSRNFFDGSFGAFNVTTALRQPGSSIKPINYAVGIDRKIVTPATMFLDVPTCFMVAGQKAYCPKNYDGSFHGPVQLRFALANSYNIPAVKMLALNTVPDFVASASAVGIKSFQDPANYGLSLTLGGGEVRMTEFAEAYSMFPNQGINKSLVAVLKVESRDGEVLYEYKDKNYVKEVIKKPLGYPDFLYIQGKRGVSKETAFLISHILLDNFARSASFGTSSYLRVPGHEAVSVKTGTTDDLKDNWTVGYTPNYLTLVWVGNNDNTPMRPGVTSGVTGAAPIWNRVMQYLLKKQPDLWPKKPDSIVGIEVCTISGMRPSVGGDGAKSCPTRFEYFIRGTEPKEGGNLKQQIPVSKDNDKAAKPEDPNIEMKEKQVLRDPFSQYCLDCNHEGENFVVQ